MSELTPRAKLDSLIHAAWLTLLAACGLLLVLPYQIHFLSQLPGTRPVTIGGVIFGVVLNVTLSYVLIRVSLSAASSLERGWPPIYWWGADAKVPKGRRDAAVTGGLLGVALSLAIGVGVALIGDRWPMREFHPPPIWVAALGSLGAGIYEEIWFRLGVMTLVAWLIMRLTTNRLAAPSVVWTANVVAALLFGAVHLPQAQALTALTPSLVAFVLVANGCVGIGCGWLYWRCGIMAAMIAHATVDLVWKVAMPLMMPHA